MQIGFYINVFKNARATRECLKSVRKFYPTAPIYLNNDGGVDYSSIAKEFNAGYYYNDTSLGYPVQPYGFTKDKAIEWLNRFYRGMVYLNNQFCDYVLMLEDDVIVVKPITVNPEWKMAGQPVLFEGQVPPIPKALIEIIESHSNNKLESNIYNCGGGSIFKIETFLNNYEWFREFLIKEMDHIQNNIYPTLGWTDCLMCVFYYMCGSQMVENKRLHNNFPLQKPFDFTKLSSEIEIVHYVKDYYD